MNNKEQDEKEQQNTNNNEENNKSQSELKINRTHRISPAVTTNTQLSNTEKKSSDEIQQKINSAHFSSSYKNKKKEKDDELHKEEIEKEIIKRQDIFKEFLTLYSKLKTNKVLEDANSNNINNSDDNGNGNIFYNKEKIFYYIINKTWFIQFKNYCQKKELSYSNINEDYPGQINNQHLILKDDSCLKLNSDNRIIINSKYSDNCTCITSEMWNYLVKICGGGPEIKFSPYKTNNDTNNEIEVIKRGVHINLLFIPKKEIISNNNNKEPSNNMSDPLNPFQCQEIKKVTNNNELKNKIQIQHIYFEINKTVQELVNYINQILNQHRNKFTNVPLYFGPTFNSERNNCLVENINYRLWLNNLDNSPEDIANFLQEQINKYEDADILLKFNKMDSLHENNFYPYLLSSFMGNKIEDIFPNKYTKNFSNQQYYPTKMEDENLFPIMTIIIEEFPYHFSEPKKNYIIKKCNFCNYRDYVFVGCICQKVYYCSDGCKKNDLTNHLTSCKKGLFHFISQKNDNLYRIILGRKEYYEKNKNEKENLPILGLTNLGNSCYMNSSLQCIFAIKELTNYFLYYFKEEHLNKKNVLGTGGALTLGYINLLLNINNTTNNKYFTPDIFKIILGLCSKKYEGNEQEDAHEFLSYLLDMLHEDLNKVIDKPTVIENNNTTNYINESDEEKSVRDWNNFLKRNQSILIDLFYGQYKSCVVCPHCNFKSVSFNSFMSLELPISENKNFILMKVCFIDHLKELPYLLFYVLLYKNELKIYYLRKKIANLLDIDMLEFELVYADRKNQIIHLYEMSEDIPIDLHLQTIYAFRVDPNIFYSDNNERIGEILKNNENENEYFSAQNENDHSINYENIEYNINKRKNEIIKFNEDKNANDDYFYFTLKYNDNIGLNSSVYQKIILQSYIVKKMNIHNFENDSILYLEKNKKCTDIYFQIFRKYFLNIAFANLHGKKRNNLHKIYNSGKTEKRNSLIKYLFSIFFKNTFFTPSELNILNNFPDCPFILFLKNDKYNITQIIPFSSNLDYTEILNKFYHKINIEKNSNDNDDESSDYNLINKSHHFNTREFNNNINNNIINNNNDLNDKNYADIITNILLNNNISNNNEHEHDITNNNINNNDNVNSNENNNIINTNTINNNNDNDNTGLENTKNNTNNNKCNSGLPGGGNTNNKKRKNSENENDENNDNNNENSGNDSENEEESESDNENNGGEENNEYSEQDTDNDEIISENSDYSNVRCNPKKYRIMDEEDIEDDIDDDLFKSSDDSHINVKRTQKDENIDKMIIVWNRKYIQNIIRFKDINLSNICAKIYEKSTNSKISIEKCFEEFSKEEKLDRDNLWKCPNCDQSLQANKKMELYNMPKILIIHLKRFDHNKKINTLIDFPLSDLDLKKYSSNKSNINNDKYDLFGVINHYGSLEYGHYTAFCKNYHDGNWYEYNDRIANRIQKEKEKEVIVNQSAYILFYRGQKNDNIKWEKIYNKQFENINEFNLKHFGQDFIYEEKQTEKENKIIDIDIDDNVNNKNNDNGNDDKNINKNMFDEILQNSAKIEKDDDSFSFKEGGNNKVEEDTINTKDKVMDLRQNLCDFQTPKFKNDNCKVNRIEEGKNNKSVVLNFTDDNKKILVDENVNSFNKVINNNNKDNVYNNNNVQCQTQIKQKIHNEEFSILKSIKKSSDNVIRITTYKRVRKNNIIINNNNNSNISTEQKDVKIKDNKTAENKKDEKIISDKKDLIVDNSNSNNNDNNNCNNSNKNKNDNNKININSNSGTCKNENELLQYDIFNQSKNYFKNNLNEKHKKPYKSVRSKELINFLLEEYSDSKSDKIPRPKKLYEESNKSTENKAKVLISFNKGKDNSENKINEKKVIPIKEEENDDLKYVNINDIDLEDFVYNPFRNCYAKTRKF